MPVDDEDFKGFEELFDQEKGSILKNKNTNNKNSGLELLSFIEDDGKRLEKLIEFFEFKLVNGTKFNQTSVFLEKQESENSQLRRNLCAQLNSPSSGFIKSISTIFNSHFQKIK